MPKPDTDRILLARVLPQDDSSSPFWLPSENHFNSPGAVTRRDSPASTKRNKQAQEKYQYGQHQ